MAIKTDYYKSIKNLIKRYPFEIIMVGVLVCFGIIQLLLLSYDFRNVILDFIECVLRRSLDRSIWNERFSDGYLLRIILSKWLSIFIIVEVFKLFYDLDMSALLARIKNDPVLKKCIVSAPIMMVITYMFVYTNAINIHDSIRFATSIGKYNNTTDKWASYFLDFLTLGYNIPWFSGLLSIFFMIFVTYMLSRIIGYNDWISIWTLSGMLVSNVCIINAHLYSGGQHNLITSLFIVCLAAYCAWYKERKFSVLLTCSFLIALACGIYSAYMPLYPSLLIALLIIELIKGEKTTRELFVSGIWYFSTFFCGLVMDFIILKISVWYSKTKIQAYMSEGELNNGIVEIIMKMIKYIPESYEKYIIYFVGRDNYLPSYLRNIILLINVSLLVFFVLLIINNWEKMKQDGRIFWLVSLLLIFPLSMNLIHVLSFGKTHFLMTFPFIIPFLFIPKIICYMYTVDGWSNWFNKLIRANLVLMTLLFIYGSILFANALYIHANNMYRQSFSIATRLLDRIENVDGFNGEENVIIFGGVCDNSYFRNSILQSDNVLDVNSPAGKWHVNGFTYVGIEQCFLKELLNCSLNMKTYGGIEQFLDENSVGESEKDQVIAMQSFPMKGSVQKIGDTIYVKLSSIN